MTLEQDALAELDEQIRADAQALAQQALDAGWRADELAVILRPWLEGVARTRAKAFARLGRGQQCTLH